MATTNPVFQVLNTFGNQELIASGKKVEELLPGQIGIFDYQKNLSLDGTATKANSEIYIAVGLGTPSETLTDVKKSAGQVIQLENLKTITVKCSAPAKPKIVELKDFKAKCETDYAIKVEFRNSAVYGLHGYNQFTKTFNYKTGCCTQVDCTSCPEGDCIELAVGIVNAVNADADKLVLAELISSTGTVITDVAAFKAANPDACLGIRLTSQIEAIKSYCSINLGYHSLRSTNIIVSTVEGFNCNGNLTTTQELQYEEGLGYDLKQLEYIDGGWNGKPGPYRVSALTGTARQGFADSTIVSNQKYTIIDLAYDQFSVGGWLEYLNNLETIVAIPCSDTQTLQDFVSTLNAILGGRLDNTISEFSCGCDQTYYSGDPSGIGIELIGD